MLSVIGDDKRFDLIYRESAREKEFKWQSNRIFDDGEQSLFTQDAKKTRSEELLKEGNIFEM